MALGYHLGAYENAGFAAVYPVQDILDAALALGAVPVNADDRYFRKAFGKYRFGLFSALADGLAGLAPAFGAAADELPSM